MCNMPSFSANKLSTICALHALHTQYTQIIRVYIKYNKIENREIKTKTKIRQIK